MKIETANRRPGFRDRARPYVTRWTHRVALLAVVSVGMFGLGAWVHKQGMIGATLETLRNYSSLPFMNSLRGLATQPPHLVIDIKHMDLQRLAYDREVALERGRLLPDARDEVPATVRLDDRTVNVKIRLKGDLPDHWKDKYKWSFRIKVKGDDSIGGMKEFSIQHPRTRDYMNDWFLHTFLRRAGLIALRYDFVEVTLNGKYLGIYAREEHFDKRLIENNGEREGVLFRADTRFYWYETPGMAEEVYGTALEPYQPGRVEADSAIGVQFTAAQNLFEAFRSGKLATHEVFDVSKLATLFAVLDLLGHHHAGHLDNLVFYYNPITSRVEPVAADNQHVDHAITLIGASRDFVDPSAAPPVDWYEMIFRDRVFFEEYIRALEWISDPATLDEFFAATREEHDHQLNILHKEFPWYSFERTRAVLYSNQGFIRANLVPAKSFQAYYAGFDPVRREVELEAISVHELPALITAATLGDSLRLTPVGEALLPAYSPARPLRQSHVALAVPAGVEWADSLGTSLMLEYRLPGSEQIQHDAVAGRRSGDAPAGPSDVVRARANVEDFPYLIDDGEGTIRIRSGHWRVARDLVVPAGKRLLCGPGVELDLVGGAMIFSYSPLEFRGSDGSPIRLRSSDGRSQGLVLQSAGVTSHFENVEFDGLGYPARAYLNLTGALTFFESPVEFTRCTFRNNRSEDGLNIVRSRFLVEDCLFMSTYSDALDVDFGEGSIVNTSFLECGNDGIDISGSIVEAQNLFVNVTGDKGLSMGEHSRLRASGVVIQNAEIAVASKDLSEFLADSLSIRDSRVGMTVFQKKPEYGPASIVANEVTLTNVERPYLIERGSVARVNGKELPADLTRVEDMLYGVEYGKSSQ